MFNGNYIFIGDCEVRPLQTAAANLDESVWVEDLWRQKTQSTHTDTQTVALIFDRDFRHTNPTKTARYPDFAELLEPLFAQAAAFFGDREGGYVVRAILTRMPARTHIPIHNDAGFSLSSSHRIHVPVLSNELVLFLVGGESKHMRPGQMWEINNLRLHAVTNNSFEPRVHMIFDWVIPGELRFFKPWPEYTAYFRRYPTTVIDFVAGDPPSVRILPPVGEMIEEPVTEELEPLVRWVNAQDGVFTQHQLQAALPELPEPALNEALGFLAMLGCVEFSHDEAL